MRRGRSISPLVYLLVGTGVFILLAGVSAFAVPSKRAPEYGATFSTIYAESLGVDWRTAYIAVLDELNIRKLRIPVYWSRIEAEEGVYDFAEIDWMMEEAERRGAKVTLVTGMKVPRWPECFIPSWAADAASEEYRRQVLTVVGETVERYKDHPALERWQVENEPFFPFGECPSSDLRRFEAEARLVRAIDEYHPVQRTTSGEQSLWPLSSNHADIVGVSMYRTVYNGTVGYVVYPLPPFFYRLHAAVTRLFVDRVIISELQMEPWMRKDPSTLTLEEKTLLFTAKDLRRNVEFANRSGMDEVYLWGVEWWYHLAIQGDAQLWDAWRDMMISGNERN